MVLFNRRKYIRRRTPQGAPLDLADATITVPESVTYTGSPLTPSVTVVYDGATLVVNTDYFVSYNDNTNVGAATVVVTGAGNYAGQVVKTFQIVSGGGGASWQDFEFTNLGDAVASAALRDTGAVYESNKNLDTYHIQVLPDGRIHFGAQLQGHAYIWGFEAEHPFDIAHFKSTYDSRSSVVMSFGSSILCNDGRSGYYSFLNGNVGIKPFTLSTAYNLSTRSEGSTLNIGASGYAMHMALSADGTKFFAKPYGSLADNYFLWQYDLSTSFDVSTADRENPTIVNLNTLTGESLTWRDFFFSPDGRHMVATTGNGLGLVHKFALSTPWDITTLSRTSYKQVFSANAALNAVAVNNDGTKMIVFNRSTAGTAEYKFYEYNLTTTAPQMSVAAISRQEYSGSGSVEPAVSVTDKNSGTTLTLGTDYTVAYSNNSKPGTATATVTGIGDYEDAEPVSVDFDIHRTISNEGTEVSVTSISGLSIEMKGSLITSYVFDNDNPRYVGITESNMIPQDFSVSVDGNTLVHGEDYDIRYGISGTSGGVSFEKYWGSYVSSKSSVPSLVYEIVPASSQRSSEFAIFEYLRWIGQDGNIYESLMKTTPDNQTNPLFQEAGMRIVFKGHYSGTFDVGQIAVSGFSHFCADAAFTSGSASYQYTGSAVKPPVTVTDRHSGLSLVEGTDYSVIYLNNVNRTSGSAEANVTFTGDYAHLPTIKLNFSIV